MIEIYGQQDCKFCRDAKVFCRMRKLPYKYYTVREDITIEEFKEMFPEARTVPQIVVDGKHIGGYTELEHYIL